MLLNHLIRPNVNIFDYEPTRTKEDERLIHEAEQRTNSPTSPPAFIPPLQSQKRKRPNEEALSMETSANISKLVQKTLNDGAFTDQTNDNCGTILTNHPYANTVQTLKRPPDHVQNSGMFMYFSNVKRRSTNTQNSQETDQTVLIVLSISGSAYNNANSKEQNVHFSGRTYPLKSTNNTIEYAHYANKNLGVTARRYRFAINKEGVINKEGAEPTPSSAQEFKSNLVESLKHLDHTSKLKYLHELYDTVSRRIKSDDLDEEDGDSDLDGVPDFFDQEEAYDEFDEWGEKEPYFEL